MPRVHRLTVTESFQWLRRLRYIPLSMTRGGRFSAAPGRCYIPPFQPYLGHPPPVASYYGIQPISPPARSRQTSPGEIYLEGRCVATADQQSADQGEPPSNPYGLLSREALGLFNLDVERNQSL